jgi:hypothetical protein
VAKIATNFLIFSMPEDNFALPESKCGVRVGQAAPEYLRRLSRKHT